MNSTASWPPWRSSRVGGVVDAVAEQRLVGEPGQRVVERLVRELVLQPAVLGDVAEAPHPPDDLAVDALRERVAFEDAAVLELEQVVALRVGLLVELLDLGDERARDRRAARARTRARGCRRAPRARRSGRRHISAKRLFQLVMRPVAVDDEDAVGGRLERRGEHRVRFAQIGFGRDPVGDVVTGRDEPFDRRVVEQVGERERERDRSRRRVPEAARRP